MSQPNRKLTDEERRLVRYLLAHGEAIGRSYLSQIDSAEVTPWKCDCGCPSLEFAIDGKLPPEDGSFEPLGTFMFGPEDEPAGLFVFACNGVLGGIEVFGFGCDPPPTLPPPEALRR